jgi:CNT family concentrative nucleoside transporter
MFFQFVIALFVFRSKPGHDIFNWASNFAQGFLGKASYGTAFVFGDDIANSGTFAVAVFPAIIFFASTVQILYYYGALQWFLGKSAVLFQAILQVSFIQMI